MKPSELSIGYWVTINGTPYQVAEISKKGWVHLCDKDGMRLPLTSDYVLDLINPVLLTTEILEKNGFTYNDENAKYGWDTWSGCGLLLRQEDDHFRIYVTSDYDDQDVNITPFVIRYVNELQMALRLRKNEKEIVL